MRIDLFLWRSSWKNRSHAKMERPRQMSFRQRSCAPNLGRIMEQIAIEVIEQNRMSNWVSENLSQGLHVFISAEGFADRRETLLLFAGVRSPSISRSISRRALGSQSGPIPAYVKPASARKRSLGSTSVRMSPLAAAAVTRSVKAAKKSGLPDDAVRSDALGRVEHNAEASMPPVRARMCDG
jgi:hypothetical protein